MKLKEILEQAIAEQASDVFIVAGLPVSFRRNGVINRINDEKLFPPDTESLLNEIYQEAGNRDLNILHNAGDDDFPLPFRGCPVFVSAPINKGRLIRSYPNYYLSPSGCSRTRNPGLCNPFGQTAAKV